MRRPLIALLTLTSLLALGGCDMLGIESASVTAEKREADGKAVGAACRHAGRAIEDCFTLNKKAEKAAVYAGWREMDDYMRENKIEPVPPQIARAEPKPKADGGDAGDKPAADDQAAAKHEH